MPVITNSVAMFLGLCWRNLGRDSTSSRLHETSIAQPSLFALQVALAAHWQSWGIKPDVVVGHSVGEIAAAHVSGALSLAEACCVAAHRGRTMDLASSKGAMIAVGLSVEDLAPRLNQLDVSIAAINGPSSLTVSGNDRCHRDTATRPGVDRRVLSQTECRVCISQRLDGSGSTTAA